MSEVVEVNIDELTCPITLELLEDPISTPCCGRAVSRQAMITIQHSSNRCPLCSASLHEFDSISSPRMVNLVYLVEQAKKSGIRIVESDAKSSAAPTDDWKCNLQILTNQFGSPSLGKLTIDSKKHSGFKTLFIPALDRSGSMAGAPFEQCKYSLSRIVDETYKNSNLLTSAVMYCDVGEEIKIDTKMSIQHTKTVVSNLRIGGGTQFISGFDKIVEIAKRYNLDNYVTSLVIVFLTDGGDTSGKSKDLLTSHLKNELQKVWTKPWVLHSIGFGQTHDFEFLNKLRVVGTSEGAYRYANPTEDFDSLSNKINSILDVVATSSVVPINIIESGTIKILSGENGKYWVDLSNANLVNDTVFKISIGDDEYEILMSCAEDQNDQKVWNEWFSLLVDEIAAEIIKLSDQKESSLDKTIHCELIEQRSKSILARLDSENPNAIRLEILLNTLEIVRKGGQIDKLKLNDMQFEGKFATKVSNSQPVIPKVSQVYSAVGNKISHFTTRSWEKYDIYKKRRLNCSRKKSIECEIVAGRSKNHEIVEWMTKHSATLKTFCNNKGNTFLHMIASIGRTKAVELLLESGFVDIDYVNKTNYKGLTALDLAILYGYTATPTLLMKYGANHSANPEDLLRTCISNGYYNTADLLVSYGKVTITDDLVSNAPYSVAAVWLSDRIGKDVPLDVAILKGMHLKVKDKLQSNTTLLSWKPFFQIFDKPTDDHIKVIKLLLDGKHVDPNEIISIDDNGEPGTSWPLFCVCEKGNMQLFNMFKKFITKEFVNFQNHRGATVLWIASCNRHVDIVGELLKIGADPNIVNLKGDGPLIAATQKGSEVVIEMLLEAGASMDAFNKNRDNPVLIACRSGQHRVLELLFNRMTEEERKISLITFAEIDGLNPLLASTEIDKVECIKVCHKFGADLEYRTADDNPIISGATAIHLACYYGRLNSAIVLKNLGINMMSQTTVSGSTPLHIAISKGHLFLVRYLMNLEEGKKCLAIPDANGRLPIYYANIVGNELILEEFFTNKLTKSMTQLLMCDESTLDKCSQVLIKYGKSTGCYEYDDITNVDISDGSTLLTYALLTGNKKLTDTLKQMGADIYKKDDFGISPAFWANYLGQSVAIDDETVGRLQRIDNVKQKSFQNKILLGVKSSPLHLLDDVANTNSLVKMTDGFGANVNKDTLTILDENLEVENSLIGFIDKLRSNKVFPDGEACLKYLMFDAKMNVIKRIAAGEELLQPVHLMALYMYTSNYTIFKQVNLSLENWSDSNIWNPFVFTLYQSISMLPSYIGEVYRAVNVKFNKSEYGIGQEISWNTFSVCSSEWKNSSDLINSRSGMVFIIHSKSGKKIDKYSKYSVDSEVIFLPATRFAITNHYVADIICLGQANIRATTFKITDRYYEKVEYNKASIIIELTEVEDIATAKTITAE